MFDAKRNKMLNGGFSLIETLVAIGILLSAISGVMFIAQQSTAISTIAGDDVVAFYLAQEPIEYVRAVRDSNKLFNIVNACNPSCVNWLAGIKTGSPPPCPGPSTCFFDIPNDSVGKCTGLSCPKILLDGNGFYNYISGEETKFVRTTRVIETVSDKEASIEVDVSWQERGSIKNFSLKETIFNW